MAERCLKHPSAYNANIMKGLTYILKDEWCFAHFTGEAEKKGGRNRFVLPSNLIYEPILLIYHNGGLMHHYFHGFIFGHHTYNKTIENN